MSNSSLLSRAFSMHRFTAVVALFAISVASADETSLIPVEDLFRNPQFSSFRISPDGETLAAIGEWENRRNLFVWDLASMEGQRLTAYKKNNVSGVMWANNDRILYFMDKEGNESLGIFAINKDGGRPRTLVEPQEGRSVGVASIRQTSILDVLIDDPRRVLVTNNDRLLDYPDVFYMDVVSGSLDVVLRNPGDVVGWLPDWNGDIRVAVYSDRESEKTGVRFRKNVDSDWEQLIEFGVEAPGWSPVNFSPDGTKLYVTSNLNEDLSSIYEFDLESKSIGRRIFHHSKVDVSNLVMSRYYKSVIGATANAEKPEVVWFAEEKRELQGILDTMFPDTLNSLSSGSLDETRIVVSSYSDRQPAKFHLVDFRGGEFRIIPLGETRPWLNPEHMASTEAYWIEARDGLPLPVYLTLPTRRDSDNPPPLLVLPHGGPWARDSWGFDPEVQLFANRGFAVLQINFRGSTGFGRKHLRESFGKFGTTMQDDIIDGVDWAIEQGFANPDRVGIYGASYGGYTAMMQVILHPDRYRFAVNYLGPTDLVDLIRFREKLRQEEVVAYYKRRIGDPEEAREQMELDSPLLRADEIKVPVFLAYGVRDPRVPIEQGTKMRSELRKHGVEHEWMSKRNEGHGFVNEENRIEFYEAVDAFMMRHLR